MDGCSWFWVGVFVIKITFLKWCTSYFQSTNYVQSQKLLVHLDEQHQVDQAGAVLAVVVAHTAKSCVLFMAVHTTDKTPSRQSMSEEEENYLSVLSQK